MRVFLQDSLPEDGCASLDLREIGELLELWYNNVVRRWKTRSPPKASRKTGCVTRTPQYRGRTISNKLTLASLERSLLTLEISTQGRSGLGEEQWTIWGVNLFLSVYGLRFSVLRWIGSALPHCFDPHEETFWLLTSSRFQRRSLLGRIVL